MTEIFKFINAEIAIGCKTILYGINLNLHKRQHTWISGINGAGKTTLCRSITGQLRIKNGIAGPIEIGYEDIRMVSFTDEGKLFHSVNNTHYYQQRFNAWDADGYLTVRDYLLAKGIDLSDNDHTKFLFEIGIQDLLDLERIKLSSGQTRKLLLASALLQRPKLLILDNPYIGLDEVSRKYLNEFLDKLVHKEDITLILSGQVKRLPKCISHRIVLKNGKIINPDTADTTVNPENAKNETLIPKIKSKLKPHQIYNSIVGPIIDFNNVSIGYKGKMVVKNFNLKIEVGEKWSLFGTNGSGKSSIVSFIFADHPQAYRERIKLFGKEIGAGTSIWDIKRFIGFTSSELHAYFRTNYSAEDVVLTGVEGGFTLKKEVHDSHKKGCSLLFAYFNLQTKMNELYSNLSTGEQRICLFLRALIKCPPLLLFDEPFQGLDQKNIELAKNLLDRIISKEQALLFISQFKEEIPNCVNKYSNLQN